MSAVCAALLGVLSPAVPSQERPTLAVVVPVTDEAESLDIDKLALIFKRKKVFWQSGARILPVNLPADSPVRRQFSRAVLKQSPQSLEDYWNQQYFQGVLPPHVLASEAAVLRFVSSTANAIGYLAACSIDATVRAVLLIDPEGNVLPPESMPECAAPSSSP
ncbi:MAG: hypothetical protein ACT4PZ_05215 [Panacagrimonas sp.]